MLGNNNGFTRLSRPYPLLVAAGAAALPPLPDPRLPHPDIEPANVSPPNLMQFYLVEAGDVYVMRPCLFRPFFTTEINQNRSRKSALLNAA